MPESPTIIHKPKLLLGEGMEEVRFFNAFLSHLHLKEIQVEQYGGRDKLSAYLRTLPQRIGFQNLVVMGITRDADDNAERAFQSVGNALRRANLSFPTRHGKFTTQTPRVGIFILPDGKSAGMLEDVCLNALQADQAMACTEEYFQCLRQRQQPVPANTSKAKLHAWLASRKLPDKRLGEAAENAFFDWEDEAFAPLQKFLTEL